MRVRGFRALALVLTVTACEADEVKVVRLRQEESASAMSLALTLRQVDSLSREQRFVGANTLDSSAASTQAVSRRIDSSLTAARARLTSAQAKHDLAVRDLNRFMVGR